MHTPQLFEVALGLRSPWRVVSVEFTPGVAGERGGLEIRLDLERGGTFACPECEANCKAHDTDEQRWRHLDFFEHEAYLVARTPPVRPRWAAAAHAAHRAASLPRARG